MIVDIQWIRRNYIQFNKEFFNNELPMINFKVNMAKKTWGYASYTYSRVKKEMYNLCITLSNYYDSPEDIKQGTLLHEMIHIYDYVKNTNTHYYTSEGRSIRGYDAHGYWFQQYANKINKASKYRIAIHVQRDEIEASVYSEKAQKRINSKIEQGYYIGFMKRHINDTFFMLKINEKQIEHADYSIRSGGWKPYYDYMDIYICHDKEYVEKRCSLKSGWGYKSKEAKADLIKKYNMKYYKTIGHIRKPHLWDYIKESSSTLIDRQTIGEYDIFPAYYEETIDFATKDIIVDMA